MPLGGLKTQNGKTRAKAGRNGSLDGFLNLHHVARKCVLKVVRSSRSPQRLSGQTGFTRLGDCSERTAQAPPLGARRRRRTLQRAVTQRYKEVREPGARKCQKTAQGGARRRCKEVPATRARSCQKKAQGGARNGCKEVPEEGARDDRNQAQMDIEKSPFSRTWSKPVARPRGPT